VKVLAFVRLRLRFTGVIVGAALLVSCTRGVVDESASPVAPTPTLVRLTITPAGGGEMAIGGSATIITTGTSPTNAGVGAFAEYSNGTRGYVAATWTSSNTSVLTVTNESILAIGPGTAVVTATFGGQSDDVQIQVFGGISGSWAGTYVVEQCSGSSGSMAEVLCTPPNTGRPAGVAHRGANLPIAMELTVTGDDVTGVVTLGNIRGTLTGKNRGGGFFYLQGVIENANGTINISHWDSRVARNQMEGFINYQVRIVGLPGVGSVATKLTTVTRLGAP
jgi:hypothetical protein